MSTTASRDGLIGIHSTALTADDYAGGLATVAAPSSGHRSPICGSMAVRPTCSSARRAGLRVCLGSDWTPSGTRNVLGELKVAARATSTALDGALDAADLVEMATANPGDTLAGPWGAPVGRIVEGALADLAVLRATSRRPVGDRARGDGAACSAGHRRRPAGVRQPFPRRACRRGRHRSNHRVGHPPRGRDDAPAGSVARRSGPDRRGQHLVEGGPAPSRNGVEGPGRGGANGRASPRAFGIEPLEFVPDMPAGPPGTEARELSAEELDQLVMPEFDGIAHTADFFERLRRTCPDHAEILRELREEILSSLRLERREHTGVLGCRPE